jgi:hypothetical protein
MDFMRSGYEDLVEIERDPSVPEEVRERIRMILARYRI